jgi:hypothetical protein
MLCKIEHSQQYLHHSGQSFAILMEQTETTKMRVLLLKKRQGTYKIFFLCTLITINVHQAEITVVGVVLWRSPYLGEGER